jgi:hypothetical protein
MTHPRTIPDAAPAFRTTLRMRSRFLIMPQLLTRRSPLPTGRDISRMSV